MKKLFLLFAILAVSITSAQTEVGGVNLPNSKTFGKYKMNLNGAGVREKFWIDLYAGGLYLETKSSDAQSIINSDEPMAVRLHIISKLVSSEKMTEAVKEGFESSTNGNLRPLQERIDKFIAFFDEEIKKDDVFDITYQPEIGTVSYKNGEEKGTIEGLDFKKALYAIWLGDKAADDGLKEDMLGK